MNAACVVLWAITGAAAVGGPAVAWRARAVAHERAVAEERRAELLHAKAAELLRLRAGRPALPGATHEEGSFAPRVVSALAAAGVPASTLVSFTPRSQRIVASSGESLTRRSAAVALSPVSLPDLGKFLDAWRRAEPAWVVSSIDVSPDAAARAAPGADLPLRVNLTLEMVHAEPTGGTP